ncbi:hypothetical protein BU24DRAFT_467924 [Aaosphaeria arxii CBS 175.79]|uniref:Uncharacterized protein n=1 Tax=Aaosphaeria arxii CBS 175.79 TaxID=1450172 RepID=A0A6A5X9D6_9PLEO|nr:uncharacterized protein BU24DRAFT_467924 [Aaosphaeria arxii CBS 175.79]KAF2009561.1 hypothetical protein BU24DRAFT_467924 [Aaosphaeria arxii CBS 175.79]
MDFEDEFHELLYIELMNALPDDATITLDNDTMGETFGQSTSAPVPNAVLPNGEVQASSQPLDESMMHAKANRFASELGSTPGSEGFNWNWEVFPYPFIPLSKEANFAYMQKHYPSLSFGSKLCGYYIPQMPQYKPRSQEEVAARYPHYFKASGEDLANDESLPKSLVEQEELSIYMCEYIWFHWTTGIFNLPPFPPKSHPIYPLWLCNHPINDIIMRAFTKLELRRIVASDPRQKIDHIAGNYDTADLRQKYARFMHARLGELEFEQLPTDLVELERLCFWISDEIYRYSKLYPDLYPPYAPKSHPCYPTWLPLHPCNQIILKRFNGGNEN